MYDVQSRLSLLVHPELIKAHENLTNAYPYYFKKYEYLKKHGFFENLKHAEFDTIKESMIKESIVKTKQIVFEVTDQCNLNCTYCAYGELYDCFDKRSHKNMNIKYAINLLKYIFDLKHKGKNNKLTISFYGGEPLLSINFIKRIVEVAKQLNYEKDLDLIFTMTTNATLIHKCIDFLVSNKFKLLVSLDGNEVNHSYRMFSKNKKNSFKKVIENLDMIQKDYPDYFINNIIFNSVLHNRNSIKDIYEFIYARYHKIPRIAELNMTDIKPDKKVLLENMFLSKRKSEEEYQKEGSYLSLKMTDKTLLYREISDFFKQYSINFYISYISALLDNEEKYLPTSTCLPFDKKIFLTNRNKLLPCEKINYKYSLGKVNESVMIDIEEITRQYNFYYNQLKRICQYCYAYRYCGLCMFKIENLDRLNTEEFVCDAFYDKKAFQNKLHRIFSFLEKYPNEISNILENIITV